MKQIIENTNNIRNLLINNEEIVKKLMAVMRGKAVRGEIMTEEQIKLFQKFVSSYDRKATSAVTALMLAETELAEIAHECEKTLSVL
ncbi:MAG: hypothetical protein LBM16_02645 [Clostridiales bacterium]|jgi:hypothetical protein|nr:hypothetical protein [Clostridiales bacterium]